MELNESTVLTAAQRPALYLGVPLPVFVAEAIFGVAAYFLIGIYMLSLTAFHFWFIYATSQDYQWPDKLWCSIKLFWLAPNRGAKKNGIVTFSPNRVGPLSLEYTNYA